MAKQIITSRLGALPFFVVVNMYHYVLYMRCVQMVKCSVKNFNGPVESPVLKLT